MTSAIVKSNINKHFDLELIRTSLAETEKNCAIFREAENRQKQTRQKEFRGSVVSIMNASNKFIDDENYGYFNERSDRFNNIDEERDTSINKNTNLIVQSGKIGDALSNRSKPFVPPKQVLMYLVR